MKRYTEGDEYSHIVEAEDGELVRYADHEAALAAVTADLEAHAVSMMKRKDAALRDWQDEKDAAERLRARLAEVARKHEAEVARLRGLLGRSVQSLGWMADRGPDTDRDEALLADINKELGDG